MGPERGSGQGLRARISLKRISRPYICYSWFSHTFCLGVADEEAGHFVYGRCFELGSFAGGEIACAEDFGGENPRAREISLERCPGRARDGTEGRRPCRGLYCGAIQELWAEVGRGRRNVFPERADGGREDFAGDELCAGAREWGAVGAANAGRFCDQQRNANGNRGY